MDLSVWSGSCRFTASFPSGLPVVLGDKIFAVLRDCLDNLILD